MLPLIWDIEIVAAAQVNARKVSAGTQNIAQRQLIISKRDKRTGLLWVNLQFLVQRTDMTDLISRTKFCIRPNHCNLAFHLDPMPLQEILYRLFLVHLRLVIHFLL